MKALFLLTTLSLISSPAAIAYSGDSQLEFAAELDQSGESVLALLEYKRFVHFEPRHPRIAEAKLKIGTLYLIAAADIPRARKSLKGLIETHPRSAEAKKASELIEFLEVHSDYSGQPLRLYWKARQAEQQGEAASAVDLLKELARKYPQARLADKALLEAASLEADELKQYAEARRTIDQLADQYPASPFIAEGHFIRAQSLERELGPDERTYAAYRAVAANKPDSPWRAKAEQAIQALKAQQLTPKRQFDKAFVQKFRVIQSEIRNQRVEIAIEVDLQLSEREIKATMEDVLFQALNQRPTPETPVHIVAYFNHPVTKAGVTKWTPGQAPVFKIEERETEDVVKDLFLEILRN